MSLYDYSLMEEQISTVELLRAMYPELILSSPTDEFLLDPSSASSSCAEMNELEMELPLVIEEERPEEITLQIILPLKLERGIMNKVKINPKQPDFINRAIYDLLLTSLPSPPPLHAQAEEEGEGDTSEYILSTIEWTKSFLQSYLPTCSSLTQLEKDKKEKEEIWMGPEERVWFWFPSLSTREKRDDLVEYARHVGLSGFVLAGKPGLLCVEGRGTTIDKYMARIKSESWSDIPSFQKKVTERLRIPLISRHSRAFKDRGMQEITHLIDQHGTYSHRGDMGQVKRLMDEWGVGDDFGAVVMNTK